MLNLLCMFGEGKRTETTSVACRLRDTRVLKSPIVFYHIVIHGLGFFMGVPENKHRDLDPTRCVLPRSCLPQWGNILPVFNISTNLLKEIDDPLTV